jgi:hypothetical protein
MRRAGVPKTVGYTQSEVVCEIIKQYVPPGLLILDCTFGKGLFWDNLLAPGLRVIKADLQRWPGIDLQADFTRLPFADQTFDVVFFDPPYHRHATATREIVKHFATTHVEYLYMAGALEIWRILRRQGLLIVKCGAGLSGVTLIVQSLQLLYRLEHEFLLVKTSGQFQTLGSLQNYHTYFVVMRKRWKIL